MLFKPYSMVNVSIIGSKSKLDKVISELHKLKVFHIIDHVKDEDMDIGNPTDMANKISGILVKLRSITSYLNIKKVDNKNEISLKKGFYEIESSINELHDKIIKIKEDLKENKLNLDVVENKIRDINSIIYLNLPLDAFSDYKHLTYFVGYCKNKNTIKNKIKKITNKFEFYGSDNNDGNLIAIFAKIEFKDKIHDLLKKESFADFNVSNLVGLKGSASENLKSLEDKKKELTSIAEKLNFELVQTKDEWKNYLLFSEDLLVDELEKAEAPLRFAESKKSFSIKGWVPKQNFDNLKFRLNKISDEKIYLIDKDATSKDDVPVKLKNPKISKPFEFLMDLYTLPNYREIDPTFITFLTFPLLFGFMLGDFGYGFVTLVLFYVLKKKFPKVKPLLNILIISSLSTIFFGLLFGEFFGSEILLGKELPHILSRSHQIMLLLYIAIVVGIIHINLGLILGFINEKSHGVFRAINEKLSWIVLQIGAGLVALSIMNKIILPVYVGYILIGLAVLMLYKAEGFIGIVEIPGIFSNILSYARLMAIGLASVKLAEVVNEFAFDFFHHGGFFILYGVLLLIIGHTVNIALGTLGPFLHSLRLHYVEFYTKFFKGGAKRFSPFGIKA